MENVAAISPGGAADKAHGRGSCGITRLSLLVRRRRSIPIILTQSCVWLLLGAGALAPRPPLRAVGRGCRLGWWSPSHWPGWRVDDRPGGWLHLHVWRPHEQCAVDGGGRSLEGFGRAMALRSHGVGMVCAAVLDSPSQARVWPGLTWEAPLAVRGSTAFLDDKGKPRRRSPAAVVL